MLSSDIPERFPIRWGESAGAGYIRAIPTASQIGVADGVASLTDGFVPLNAAPIGAGGVPPDIKDMNGALYRITGWARWVAAGGPIYFNSTFATAIGGYPKQAIVASTATPGAFWVSGIENNTVNPDIDPTNWTLLAPIAATNGEILAGTANNRFISPAGLAGLRASGADLVAGTDNAKYATPGSLATLRAIASEILAGTDAAKYITAAALAGTRAAKADVDGGTNNAKLLTAAALLGADGTDFHFANPGYFTFPGGLRLQFGDFTFTSDTTVTVTFPKAFSTPIIFFPTQYQTGGGDQDNNAISSEALTATQWSGYCWGAGGGRGMRMKWWALGLK